MSYKIDKPKNDNRQRISIATAKDFDVSYFCGSGAGGQARNKVASGVQITHRESGAMGRASDSRSQDENKKNAFKRLLATPQMKFWITKKCYEIRKGETMEQEVEQSCKAPNLKHEIQIDGKWTEVPEEYFESTKAKIEA